MRDKPIDGSEFITAWTLNFIPPQNAKATWSGFWDRATGEAICPFRGTVCIGSKCNWWDAVKKDIARDPYGERHVHFCWWVVLGYEYDTYGFEKTTPEKVLQELKRDGTTVLNITVPPLIL